MSWLLRAARQSSTTQPADVSAIKLILRTWNACTPDGKLLHIHICGRGCACGGTSRNLALFRAVKGLLWRQCPRPSRTRWTSMVPGTAPFPRCLWWCLQPLSTKQALCLRLGDPPTQELYVTWIGACRSSELPCTKGEVLPMALGQRVASGMAFAAMWLLLDVALVAVDAGIEAGPALCGAASIRVYMPQPRSTDPVHSRGCSCVCLHVNISPGHTARLTFRMHDNTRSRALPLSLSTSAAL